MSDLDQFHATLREALTTATGNIRKRGPNSGHISFALSQRQIILCLDALRPILDPMFRELDNLTDFADEIWKDERLQMDLEAYGELGQRIVTATAALNTARGDR